VFGQSRDLLTNATCAVSRLPKTRQSILRSAMNEVHRSKVVSSVEQRALRKNVTTEVEWEVNSLKHQFEIASLEWISKSGIILHGTEGPSNCPASTQLSLEKKGQFYVLNLGAIEHYIFSVEAKLCCVGHEQKCNGLKTNGRHICLDGDLTLFKVAFASELGRAMQEHDSFTATVRMTTLSADGEVRETTLDTPLEVHPQLSLSDNLRAALASGDFADVTLKSQEGDAFPAHRQLLAMRSPVLRAMFYGSMREAQSGIANISASSAGVRQLLRCIYTDEVEVNVVERILSELLELGAQYEVPRLVALVKEQALHSLAVHNVVDRFLLALRHSVGELEAACEKIIKSNISAVMQTEGWTQLAQNPEAMAMLMNGGKKRRDPHEVSPKKLKRPRSAGNAG